ncbi:MAG: ATP-binding protein [Methylococcales bacterium]
MHWAYTALEIIKKKNIAHRNWRFALNDAFALLIASAVGEVICITGPLRAGKSKLIKALMKLIEGGNQQINTDDQIAVNVLATNCSVGGAFCTKAFTIRALEAVRHPIYGIVHDDVEKEIKRQRLLGRTAEGVLRPALESALRIRNTRYIFIDEAQHIEHAKRGLKGTKAILDSWKCLAQSTDTTLILVGAYPILELLKSCSHMLGRKHQVHLPRYTVKDNDLLAFSEIVDAYNDHVILPKGVSSLEEWADLLYDGSLGCIGLLEGWLRDALARVISYGNDELTQEHFKITRRPLSEEQEIVREIIEGEAFLEKDDTELRDENYIIEPPSKLPSGPASKKRKRKPFQRNPKRYKIGGRLPKK